MIWAFLLVMALGLVVFRLGSYSVWVAVLTIALKLTLLVVILGIVVLVWRRFGPAMAPKLWLNKKINKN